MLHDRVFTDAAEKLSNVEESVVRAKEAVGLDVQDGVSWSESTPSQ